MNIGGTNGVEGEFEEKSPVCWTKETERDRYERWTEREIERKEDGNDRRYGKRESDGGTAKVEKIFANMRDERHGEAGREKDRGGKHAQ